MHAYHAHSPALIGVTSRRAIVRVLVLLVFAAWRWRPGAVFGLGLFHMLGLVRCLQTACSEQTTTDVLYNM